MSGTHPPPEKDSHPNRGTLGQPPMGGGDHLYLSSDQLRDDDRPSWKAPRERSGTGWLVLALVIAVIVLAVLVLVITGAL